MYTLHFGLTETPFSITPDPRYLYLSPQHREGLAHLLFGIEQPGGFVQLTGEVGTGKTILCRCLLEQLPRDVDVALVLHPPLTAGELLASICDELRIAYPAGTRSLKDLVDALYRHLLDAHARGRRTVLILDEAQNLSAGVLEQVRLLTNLETATQKLLQIILIGQPELLRLLGQRQLRQLAQRITARCHLRPFSKSETCSYIAHRVQVAGGGDAIFTPAAMRRIHRLSRGVPRVINVLCDRALLGAYARGQHQAGVRIVGRAARELRGTGRAWRPLRPAWPAALIAVAAVAVAATLLLGRGRTDLWRLGAAPSVRPAEPARALSAAQLPSGAAVPAPREAATAAAVEPAAGPPTRLADLLADGAASGDRRAFASIYARWGLPYAEGTAGCGPPGTHGLECAIRRGNWTRLRRFDLPAVLELATPAGERRRVALLGLGEREATLALGGGERRFSLAEIDAFWDGSFIILWRPPDIRARLVAPGAQGDQVRWVRQRLDALEGVSASGEGDDLYDEALRQRVAAFQRARRLAPDGVVGEETLLELAIATRGPDVPSLSRAGP